MIIDRYNEFSDAQAVTSTGDTASTNVVDTFGGGDALGEEIYLHIKVNEAVTSAGAATVQFVLQTDSDEAFGSATDIYTSAAIGKATLVAGHNAVRVRIPSGCERYLRVKYTVGVAALTAGKFDAFLSPSVQANDFSS